MHNARNHGAADERPVVKCLPHAVRKLAASAAASNYVSHLNVEPHVNHEKFATLNADLEPLRNQLCHHAVYSLLNDIDDLKCFMSHHVFAVWDFMSLLKALQQEYCSSRIPWVPHENRLAARLVNEIVLAEETDEGPDGEYISHFGMYRQAMGQVGAPSESIDRLLAELERGRPIEVCLAEVDLPENVRAFVTHTFQVIQSGQPEELAAVFLFGREDLIPDMFDQIVGSLNREQEGQLACFEYYLNRHIELDGETHGPMAELLLVNLCGQDDKKWERARNAATHTLQQRILLWDGIAEAISRNRLIGV